MAMSASRRMVWVRFTAGRPYWRQQPVGIGGSAPTRAAVALAFATSTRTYSSVQTHSPTPKWRPISVLDDWVAKEARPISLRQLMVFGRSLTETRLISSANYVRTELPTRLAHRIRDIQKLPFAVVSNPHISAVYELYYNAFDLLRKVKPIKTLDDNEQLCKIIDHTLQTHLSVIPKLAMGILETGDLMHEQPGALDKFMNTILRSRISRRVIAEQHLALTETFNAPWYSPGAPLPNDAHEFIGEVFLKCVAHEVIDRCGRTVCALARSAYGPDVALPAIQLTGNLDTTFPYILSHLEYIIGELLRNAVQAVVEKHQRMVAAGQTPAEQPPPPIEVTICEAQQHVIIRVSDQGGGVPQDMLPYLWSFSKGPHSQRLLENLQMVPRMSATLQELRADDHHHSLPHPPRPPRNHRRAPEMVAAQNHHSHHEADLAESAYYYNSSLTSLSRRPPNLRLGVGLPLSRVYAEYWAGSLELHSLEGYGVDVFLQISKLGNKNEQVTMRATMDAV